MHCQFHNSTVALDRAPRKPAMAASKVQQPSNNEAAMVSTTSTNEHLADQLALSRLDDDGAPHGPQAPTSATTVAQASGNGARLSLVPATASCRPGGWVVAALEGRDR